MKGLTYPIEFYSDRRFYVVEARSVPPFIESERIVFPYHGVA
jgi:hypothetical protein